MTTEGNDQRRHVVQLQETARPRETEPGRRIARAFGFTFSPDFPSTIIVGLRSAGDGRGWPWTLAWLSLWLVFFVVIFIMLLSAPPDICQDCGAVF